ncbi:MAG TPA: hypothetical protein PKD20_00340 [Candidatus Saccharibacteria bacterium]|nr:hypothetical protein [Candidatus Saccharibacteria bacterium]HMT55305.1 hypothetical protein [Candidatus Saccharibacteria bacterium]
MQEVFIDLSVKEAYVKSVYRLLVGSAVLVSIVALAGKKIDQVSYSVANSIVNNDKKAITVALVQEFGSNPAASYDRRAYAYTHAKELYKFSVATSTNSDTVNSYAHTKNQNIFLSSSMSVTSIIAHSETAYATVPRIF